MNINRLQKFIKRPDNFYTLVTCCLYLGLSLAFIGRAGNIINPDGVEYSVIATHYAHGDFHAAINGIWSPLLSWLLVIPAFFNLSVLLFFRLILVGLSLATIVASSYFLRQFFDAKRTPYLHHLGLLFITLFCFYATILTPMTPDLFSVFFIIWFMAALTAYHYQPTPRRALYIGAVGGLGYYGKNYFAYFAATAIIIFLVIRAVTHQSNVHQAIKHAAMSMATLIIIVLPWICLMSYKYGHFTTNPIGAYAMGNKIPMALLKVS